MREERSRTWRHRTEQHRHSDLPGAERVHTSIWRVAALLGAAGLAMAAGLHWAVSYAERDWADKNAAAHSRKAKAAAVAAESDGEAEGAAEAGEGWRYEAVGRGEAALRVAGRPGKGGWSWGASAGAAARRGEGKAARVAVRMATASGGDWAAGLNLLGTLDMEAGRFGAARRKFAAAEAAGSRAGAFNAAVCDMTTGRARAAVAEMTRFALRRDAGDEGARTLGRWLWDVGRRDEAVKTLRMHAGEGSPLLRDVAVYEALRGNKEAAVAALRGALDAVPLSQAIRTFQSPAFREAALTEDGRALLGELAWRARERLGAGGGDALPEPVGRRTGGAVGLLRR